MIDAALQYGWETHAGFTKAFKKGFGFSPSFLEFMLNEIRYIGGEDMNDSCALGTTKQGMSKEVLYNVLVGKMRCLIIRQSWSGFICARTELMRE